MKTYTKGNVIVEDIKIGDIHYEFEYNMCIKSKVKTLPVKDGDYWSWESTHIKPDGTEGKTINYGVTEGLSHYGPNLYDCEAYEGCKQI